MPNEIRVLDQDKKINFNEKKKCVKQGNSKIVLYSKDNESSILLYTKGLNPCIGIILKGKILFKKVDEFNFVILNHYQDTLLNKSTNPIELQKQIEKHVQSNLQKMVDSVGAHPLFMDEDDSDLEIVISDSSIVYVTQNNLTSSQNIMVNELKKILESKAKLPEIAREEEINISLSSDYHFSFYETQEHKSAACALDCYIQHDKNDEALKIYTQFQVVPHSQIGHKRNLFKSQDETLNDSIIKETLEAKKKFKN